MNDYVSPKPTGSDPESTFHQETWDATRGPAAQLRSSSTVQVIKTPRGIFFKAKPGTGGGSPPSALAFKFFKTMFANYWIATDGTRVAKPYKLRNSVASEKNSEGVIYNFSYQGASAGAIAYIARSKTGGNLAVPELQRIAPIYCANPADEIIALQIKTSVVSEAADTGVQVGTVIGWVEIEDQRKWCKKIDQSTP